MNQVFGREYAGSYDTLYHDKDYAGECDLIEHVFRVYGDGRVSSVLDLGCGTGNHALPMARRGYEVVGVERSASMLSRARQKLAAENRANETLHEADLRRVDL